MSGAWDVDHVRKQLRELGRAAAGGIRRLAEQYDSAVSTPEQATSLLPPSIWTGIVAGLFAFCGVILAQLYQGKRDEKNREHERIIYSDTWGEQRDRDRELWNREDRFRFAQDRRKLYGDFLARHATFSDHIRHMERRRNHDNDPDPADIKKAEEIAGKFRSVVNQITIAAPKPISNATKNIFDEVANVFIKVADTPPGITISPNPYDSLLTAARNTRPLVEEMRKDVGAVD
jgi:hypothetical protein